MVMMLVGGFAMGAPGERGTGPVRDVTISEPFAAGLYEVTLEEWDACTRDGGCGGHRPPDWRLRGRWAHPVTGVSWEDAQAYARWLSRKTGEDYRLLSEAQWEYAAWRPVYAPGFPAHGFASYSTIRNFPWRDVWEWVQDCWNADYEGAPSDGSAWDAGDCGRRVLRGSSRAALRVGSEAEWRAVETGFRVARTLHPSRPAHRWRLRARRATFQDCPECPEMMTVPTGSFMMGSPPSEEGRYDDEGPMHRVTIAEPFAAGVYEVTFEEWDACVSGGGCGGYRPDAYGWGGGRRPVINVSWEDARAYVDWLSGKTGEAYRLLSEAEWEYGARAGTTTRYYWGDDIAWNRANWGGYDDGLHDAVFGLAARVESFAANGFGLHDMHGNVWEWVEDCWNGSYAGAPSDGSAWLSGDCGLRVLRGGSRGDAPKALRSAGRAWIDTGDRGVNVGFRVARALGPQGLLPASGRRGHPRDRGRR